MKVLDFGVARAMDSTSSTVTRTGAMLGTPAYMSPEQARGKPSELSARSDIYSAGATLLFLVAGEFIHEGESAQEIMVRSAWTPPKKMGERRLGIPPAIAAIIDRACEFDPNDRYQTAAEMWSDLESARTVLAGDPRSTEPIARTSKVPPRGPLFTAPLPLTHQTPGSSAERTVADLMPALPMYSWGPSDPRRRVALTVGAVGAIVLAVLVAVMLRTGTHSDPVRAVQPVQPTTATPIARVAAPTPTHEVVPTPTAATAVVTEESTPVPKTVNRAEGTKRHSTTGARTDAPRASAVLLAPPPSTTPAPNTVSMAAASSRAGAFPPVVKPAGRDVGY